MKIMDCNYTLRGNYWIEDVTEDEAYEIADSISKYVRKNDIYKSFYINARAVELSRGNWTVHVSYSIDMRNPDSMEKLYVNITECEIAMKDILDMISRSEPVYE